MVNHQYLIFMYSTYGFQEVCHRLAHGKAAMKPSGKKIIQILCCVSTFKDQNLVGNDFPYGNKSWTLKKQYRKNIDAFKV